jgi:PAS domain S-box-containing protein
VLVVDTNGQTTVYNQKFAEMWRIPPELLEERIDEQMLRYVLTQLDNPTEFINKVNDLYKQPGLSSIDDIKLADGRIFERYSIPQRINDEIVGRVWSFRDISERVKSELVLRDSEEKFRLMFENNPQPMFIYDMETLVFLDVNDSAVNHYGYSRDEFLSMSIKDIRPAEVIPDLMNYLISVNRGDKILFNTEHLKKNGERIYVEVISAPVLTQGRQARHALVSDITERKKTEMLLAKSEQFFRQSQQAGKIGSYSLSLKTGLWESSEVMNDIFGIDDNYVKSIEGWVDIVAPVDREMMSVYFQEHVLGLRMPFNKEYRIQRKSDGEIRWVLGQGELIIEDDAITFMVGTIQDIDERKKAEIQLQEKMDELMRFQHVTVGRELVMISLKKEINELLIKLGLEPKYKIVE